MQNRHPVFDIIYSNTSDQEKIKQLDRVLKQNPVNLMDLKVNDSGVLLVACLTSGKELLEWLLLQEPKLIQTDQFSCEVAASLGKLELLKKLIEYKADIFRCNRNGLSALHGAVWMYKRQIITFLIETCKMDVNLISKQNSDTPFMIAAAGGDLDIVKQLVEFKANINYVNEEGSSAIHSAVYRDNPQVITYLIETCKADVNQNNDEGFRPLLYAAQEGKLGALKLLVEHKANINHTTKDGASAIHLAAKHGHAEIIDYLFTNKADINFVHEPSGVTPCMLAAQEGKLDALKKLIEFKANLASKSKDGNPVFDFAKKCGHAQIVAYVDSLNKIKIVISHNKVLHEGIFDRAELESHPKIEKIGLPGAIGFVLENNKIKKIASHHDVGCLVFFPNFNEKLSKVGKGPLVLRNDVKFASFMKYVLALPENFTMPSTMPSKVRVLNPKDILGIYLSDKKDAAPQSEIQSAASLSLDKRKEKKLERERRRKERRKAAKNAGNDPRELAQERKITDPQVKKDSPQNEPAPIVDQLSDDDSEEDNLVSARPFGRSELMPSQPQPPEYEDNEGFQPVVRKKFRHYTKEAAKIASSSSQLPVLVLPEEDKAQLSPERYQAPRDSTASQVFPLRLGFLMPQAAATEGKTNLALGEQQHPAEGSVTPLLPGLHIHQERAASYHLLPAEGSAATRLPGLLVHEGAVPERKVELSLARQQIPADCGTDPRIFPLPPEYLVSPPADLEEEQPGVLPEYKGPSPTLFSFKPDHLRLICSYFKVKIPSLNMTLPRLDDAQQYLLIKLSLEQANKIGLLGIEIQEFSQSGSNFNAKICVQEILKKQTNAEQAAELNEPGAEGQNKDPAEKAAGELVPALSREKLSVK